MPLPAAADPQLAFVFRRPFAEQVAFFRGKLGNLVPTARWDDIWKSAHDRAFMVAGAAKADLLADLADAVDKAIAEGETLDAFRRRFAAIVEKHGWHGWTGEETAAGRAWRTRIIYQTNLATSYAAGRLAQLRDAGFRYWIYRHTPNEHPRLQHLAWDGLTLPADHPFWQTHYPPSGWGCRCRAVGADGPESAKLLGGKPGYTEPPAGWDAIDPKTGEPPGIDKGWGYMPGGSVICAGLHAAGNGRRCIDMALVSTIGEKAAKLPQQVGGGLIADLVRRAFGVWFAAPTGKFPLARLPDADATTLGAREGVRVANMSAETALKQRREHPELTAAEYAQAQRVIDAADVKVLEGQPTGTRDLIYAIKDDVGGYVLIVKATRRGDELWVKSFFRLSSKDALRDREIRRLLRKGEKK